VLSRARDERTDPCGCRSGPRREVDRALIRKGVADVAIKVGALGRGREERLRDRARDSEYRYTAPLWKRMVSVASLL
jgi:hypothetical protein